MADNFSLCIENIERHFIFRRGLEIIIDHRTGGRVVADWLASVEFLRIMQTQRGFRLVKNKIRARRLRAQLPKRREIVQHPKRSAMRRHDQIVVLDYQIMNRRARQI